MLISESSTEETSPIMSELLLQWKINKFYKLETNTSLWKLPLEFQTKTTDETQMKTESLILRLSYKMKLSADTSLGSRYVKENLFLLFWFEYFHKTPILL